jgi:hypothetical protein
VGRGSRSGARPVSSDGDGPKRAPKARRTSGSSRLRPSDRALPVGSFWTPVRGPTGSLDTSLGPNPSPGRSTPGPMNAASRTDPGLPRSSRRFSPASGIDEKTPLLVYGDADMSWGGEGRHRGLEGSRVPDEQVTGRKVPSRIGPGSALSDLGGEEGRCRSEACPSGVRPGGDVPRRGSLRRSRQTGGRGRAGSSLSVPILRDEGPVNTETHQVPQLGPRSASKRGLPLLG